MRPVRRPLGQPARLPSERESPVRPRRLLAPVPPGRPPTLVEHALDAIRRAIVYGELKPGERLWEEELAAQLGISRVPVREALRALEYEGLIRSEPHRGSYVAAPAEEEIEEIYRIRAEVEATAAGGAARVIAGRPERVAPYQELLGRMRHAAAAGDLHDLAAADLDFHRLILDDSGYSVLPRVWSAMFGIVRGRLSIILASAPRHDDVVAYTAESHAPIVAALATGDPERAAAAVRQHILETHELWKRVKG